MSFAVKEPSEPALGGFKDNSAISGPVLDLTKDVNKD